MYCTKCGTRNDPSALYCTSCGTAIVNPAAGSQVLYVRSEKNAGIAIILSFLLSGLGQIYNGEIGKGVAFMIAYAVSWLLIFVFIGVFLLPIVWIWSMIDAYQGAERYNRILRVTVPPPPSSV